MPPTKYVKLQSIVITAIASNFISKDILFFQKKSYFLLAVGNGDGSDLYFTVGNYDELLGRFQLVHNNGNDSTVCKVNYLLFLYDI